MPHTMELTELDARITDTELPETEAMSGQCSNVCTILVCATVVIC